jgi:hypothetical protein
MISSSYILFWIITANDSSFDLSLQFNGYPIAEAKAELQNCCFYAIENFIESKKKKKLLHSI